MKLISCEDLRVGYDNKTVLNNVNLDIINGDYICIVGENGSGKSTLFKTILHLIPPLGGKIKYDSSIKKATTGYLQQDTEIDSAFPATVYEIVLSGCINRLGKRPFYGKRERELANRYINLLQIGNSRNASLKKLSGGQQQRVLLARALCSTDKILFLDEPFNRLDLYMSQHLYAILELINKEYGVTIVMICHNIASALEHVNKVVHVDKTVTFVGTPQEYLESEIGKKYLGGEKND